MTISEEEASPRSRPYAGKEKPGRELVAELFRVLAAPLVAILLRLRVPPPAVVLVHTAIGLGAALAIAAEALVLAAVLLQLKTLLDNADGQLARMSDRVTALGRYLDTEADFLVNGALFVALASVTGMAWLAAAAFVCLTLLLGVDFNVSALYDEARGRTAVLPPVAGSALERALAGGYRAVFAPQDRLVRAFSRRRLERVVGAEADPERVERATLAYHDRVTATIIANLGLSTQLLVLGVCLVLGSPAAYLWIVVGSLALLPLLELRREKLARLALSGRREA